MPTEWTVSLGEANEQLQERFGVSRERQDEFAARSHRLADQAWTDGFYDEFAVAGARVADLARDESIRPGSTPEIAGRAEAVVPPRRHDHRGQRLPAQRRCLGGAARIRAARRR